MKFKILAILLLVAVLFYPVRADDGLPDEVQPETPMGGGPPVWSPLPMIIIGIVSALIIIYVCLLSYVRLSDVKG